MMYAVPACRARERNESPFVALLFQMLNCLKGETRKVGSHNTTLPREEVLEKELEHSERASLKTRLKAFFMSILMTAKSLSDQ